jgi:hypothetical protein
LVGRELQGEEERPKNGESAEEVCSEKEINRKAK